MARKEKVTENTSTLETQRPPQEATEAQPSAEGGLLELVEDPGPVKRITFEGAPEPAFVAPPAPAAEESQEFRRAVAQPSRSESYSSESLHSIRSEVDRLNAPDASFAGAPRRANLEPWRVATESRTLYRTERGGEVRAYEGPSGRTFTLSDGREERRFNESEVDRVIQGIELQRAAGRPAAPETETVPEEKPKRGLFGFLGRKGKAKEEAATEYQPQCSAVTAEGAQCRNSARDGSKYCSSHFGYQPRTAQGAHAQRDTEPRFASSQDTVPGGWDPSRQGSAQCAAVTKDHLQCQNPVVAGSPYCGSHQSYQEPDARAIIDSLDTKPRWAGAKDTKPAARKAPRKAAGKGTSRRKK